MFVQHASHMSVMFVDTTNMVIVNLERFVENYILMNCVLFLHVIQGLVIKDIQEIANTTPTTEDASSILASLLTQKGLMI